MDDERLKQAKTAFGKDYFRELLERVRSIRASERRIWQQITDIYVECSFGYDSKSPAHLTVGMAQFELTDEQVEMLNTGVIKVRLTTTPFIHEREFTKDKIGKKLYKAFSKQKNSEF